MRVPLTMPASHLPAISVRYPAAAIFVPMAVLKKGSVSSAERRTGCQLVSAYHVTRHPREARDRVSWVVDLSGRVERVHVIGVAAALQGGARGPAALVHVRTIEFNSLRHQRVQRWGADLVGGRHVLPANGIIAMPAGLGPTPVVEENHDDMRLLTGRGSDETLLEPAVVPCERARLVHGVTTFAHAPSGRPCGSTHRSASDKAAPRDISTLAATHSLIMTCVPCSTEFCQGKVHCLS